MSGTGQDASKLASPRPARHQPAPSITELSSPIRLHRHHHYLHKHQPRDRDDKPSVSQSTTPALPGRISLDGIKSEGATPNLSPNPSRRASVLVANEDNAVSVSTVPASLETKSLARGEEVAIATEKTLARNVALKQMLVDIEAKSVESSRLLNLTYGSILEKQSNLLGTVTALKELVVLCQEIEEDFVKEATQTIGNIQSQLDAFDGFSESKEQIRTLQRRLIDYRQSTQNLSERVDVVLGQIEGWERADREWQERTRRRLTIIWWIMSAIVFVFILLFVTAQYAPEGLEEATIRFANESIHKLRNTTLGTHSGELLEKAENSSTRLQSLLNRTNSTSTSGEDPRLRVFDEL